jgi:hypothetical protein
MSGTHSVLQRTFLACALLGSVTAIAQPKEDGIVPYRAVYGLYNGDKRVAESVFMLRYDARSGHYEFETRSEFRGLLQIAAPRPVVEHSEFTVVAGEIRPLTFTYRDGTRRGRRNIDLRFDWKDNRLIVEHDGLQEELPLAPRVLDRASVRVALMRELAAAAVSPSYEVADPGVIRTYGNRSEGTETVTTALGRLAVQKISQQRRESSRRTVVWAARELHFLPVRIEQLRDDRDPVAFVLESVEWLSGTQADSSP